VHLHELLIGGHLSHVRAVRDDAFFTDQDPQM
jgi:hypothetical protein